MRTIAKEMGSVDDLVERNLADLSDFLPPSGSLVLAEDSGTFVGIGCLKTIAPGIGEVKRMYVRPRARGRGVARGILEALLDAAREVGHERVRLDSVKFMTAAHFLYRSAGFVFIEPYPESEIPPILWPYWVFMERVN